jgi:polyphosphate kinase
MTTSRLVPSQTPSGGAHDASEDAAARQASSDRGGDGAADGPKTGDRKTSRPEAGTREKKGEKKGERHEAETGHGDSKLHHKDGKSDDRDPHRPILSEVRPVPETPDARERSAREAALAAPPSPLEGNTPPEQSSGAAPPPGAEGAAPIAPDLDAPSLFVNRETSWLAFNERVLEEARSRRWPLLERLKFLAIYASNLDEFFMIRVSGLHEQLEAKLIETSADGLSPREQLNRIGQIVRRQRQICSSLLADDLLPALANHGIHLRDWKALGTDTRRLARQYFRRSVFPVVTPLAVDPAHPFPFLSNLSLSLAVEARDPVTKERKFARVKVPEILPRFVPLGELDPARATAVSGMHEFLPLEQLLAANLEDLFPGMEILGCYPFRVTRDMDIEILEDEAHDLLSIVDREIRRRRFGACVRLEVSAGIPDRIRKLLAEKLEIDEEDVYECTEPLGLSGLMSIAQINVPDLRDPPFTPRLPNELADNPDIFSVVRNKDVLLHHPYDSFTPVLEFLRRAADDPHVLAIKMTLYRAGSNAEAVRLLIRAAENGKQVAASIEIKARFDEENNIQWARALERAGAHVFFGRVDLKIHAKVALVVRREEDGLRRYVHLSTGNYNAGTARIYTDLGLLTADPSFGEDVSEFFNSLSGFSKKANHRKLTVAPIDLGEAVLEKIDHQTERAKAGKPAYIFAKMNALVDKRVIQSLYRASMAGVDVDLCVRGVCCLRPGLKGISERIRVFSVIGRFLEHERVFVFGPPEHATYYLSSADWMPRNLYRRVEVLFPVESPALREQIRHEVLEPALADNAHAYEMDVEGCYARRVPKEGEAVRSAQTDVLDRVLQRTLQAIATG